SHFVGLRPPAHFVGFSRSRLWIVCLVRCDFEWRRIISSSPVGVVADGGFEHLSPTVWRNREPRHNLRLNTLFLQSLGSEPELVGSMRLGEADEEDMLHRPDEHIGAEENRQIFTADEVQLN